MGRRTGAEPDGAQTLVVRICHALDVSPTELAKSAGVSPAAVKALVEARPQEIDFVSGETWWKISEYVDRQLGMLMAVKLDLNRALQKDRTQHVLRNALVSAREKRSSPR